MLAPSAFAIISPVDFSQIGIGPRAMGMGGAAMGLSNDANGMFNNPAGMGLIKTPCLSLSSTKLMGQVQYIQAGGAYPTKYGTIGIGYIGTSISGSLVTLLETNQLVPRIISTGQAMGYSGTNFLITYGTKLSAFAKSPAMDKISIGATLKYLRSSVSGPTAATSASGTGIELDIGVSIKPIRFLTVGITGMNILPGNRINYTTAGSSVGEEVPAIIKIGTAVEIIGKNGLKPHNKQRLIAAVDIDVPSSKAGKNALHAGVEYCPIEYLAVRAGLDQTTISDGQGSTKLESNLTFGVGLNYSGFVADYAYHKFGSLKENNTHYFSIGYKAPIREKKVVVKKEIIGFYEPNDKLITNKRKIKVRGNITERVDQILVNGKPAKLKFSEFETDISLKIGRNTIRVEAKRNGKLVDKRDTRALRLISFWDVPNTYWAKDYVDNIATAGLVEGYPGGLFKPRKPITRAELTAVLARTKGYDMEVVSRRKIFKDLPTRHWASKYVNAAVKDGLVRGYPDGRFKPSKRIARSEAAAAFVRFDGLKTYKGVVSKPFYDVPARHWAARYIDAAKQADLIQGYPNGKFMLKKPVVRAEAAKMLATSMYGQNKINELRDWDSYTYNGQPLELK